MPVAACTLDVHVLLVVHVLRAATGCGRPAPLHVCPHMACSGWRIDCNGRDRRDTLELLTNLVMNQAKSAKSVLRSSSALLQSPFTFHIRLYPLP